MYPEQIGPWWPASANERAFAFKSSNPSSIQQMGSPLRSWQYKRATSIFSNYSDEQEKLDEANLILSQLCKKEKVASDKLVL